MNILLFGKTGQVGSALIQAMSSETSMTALGRDGSANLSGNLADAERIACTVRSVSPDIVVNAAAYTAVDRAEEEQQLAYAINAEAPAAMANACRDVGALLVHYSTDYVFSGDGVRPWREDDPVRPINEYGRTKHAGEEGIRQSGCRHLIFRTSWVYAPDGNNFLRTMLRLAAERDTLDIVDDQWGVPTHAGLIADVTARMIRRGQGDSAATGLFHLAPAGETTWYRYARHAIDRARRQGWPVRVEPRAIRPVGSNAFPTPAKRPLNSRLDCQKLERLLGVTMPDWQEGVDSAVDSMVARQNRETSQ